MKILMLILLYLIIVNFIGFLMMGIDKQKAIKGAFRIPEATLFVIALIGGSIGSIVGMYTFRHKTRHFSFVYGMPAILILQVILIILLLIAPIQFLAM